MLAWLPSLAVNLTSLGRIERWIQHLLQLLHQFMNNSNSWCGNLFSICSTSQLFLLQNIGSTVDVFSKMQEILFYLWYRYCMNNRLWRYAQLWCRLGNETFTILHKVAVQGRSSLGERGMLQYNIYIDRTLQKYKTASLNSSLITLKKHHQKAFPSRLKHLNLS